MWNKDWRGYLLKLRWQAARSLVPRRTVASRGLTFTLQCDNWKTYYRWQTYNHKEPETLDWIDQTFKAGDVFFDIGANIGVYSIYAALRHPKVKVVAFEPEYSNLHLFRDNIVENGLKDRIDVYAVALGDKAGISYLHIQDFSPGAALHTLSREPITMTRTRFPVIWKEGVWSMALDQFCAETGLCPNGIKLDVDGSELEILEGALQTLRAPSMRSILVESEDPQRSRCGGLLREAGFKLLWEDSTGRSPNEVWGRRSE